MQSKVTLKYVYSCRDGSVQATQVIQSLVAQVVQSLLNVCAWYYSAGYTIHRMATYLERLRMWVFARPFHVRLSWVCRCHESAHTNFWQNSNSSFVSAVALTCKIPKMVIAGDWGYTLCLCLLWVVTVSSHLLDSPSYRVQKEMSTKSTFQS